MNQIFFFNHNLNFNLPGENSQWEKKFNDNSRLLVTLNTTSNVLSTSTARRIVDVLYPNHPCMNHLETQTVDVDVPLFPELELSRAVMSLRGG